jgi:hypothetical protein
VLDNVHYGPDSLSRWRRDRRIAHPDVLAFYLEKQLPEDSLPTREVRELFEAFGKRERLYELLEAMDSEALERALERLEDYEEDYLPSHVEVAVEVLSNQLPRLREESEGFLDLGAALKLERVVYRLLRTIEDQKALAIMVKELLVRLRTLSARLMIVKIVGHRENVGHRLVSKEDATHLEKQLLTAMEQASPQSLAQERDLVRLMFVARDVDPEKGEALIVRLGEKDAIFLSALRNIHRKSHSIASGEVISRERRELAWDTLVSLFGEDIVRRRVRELFSLVESSPGGTQEVDLDERTRDALRLAQRYASGWRPS